MNSHTVQWEMLHFVKISFDIFNRTFCYRTINVIQLRINLLQLIFWAMLNDEVKQPRWTCLASHRWIFERSSAASITFCNNCLLCPSNICTKQRHNQHKPTFYSLQFWHISKFLNQIETKTKTAKKLNPAKMSHRMDNRIDFF